MVRWRLAIVIAVLCALVLVPAVQAAEVQYGDVTLTSSGAEDSGSFADVWDLTQGDITISFTYDANGLVDDFGGAAHAWAELGVRSVGSGAVNFNPYWRYTYNSTTMDLVAGSDGLDAGDVSVWSDADNIYVLYAVGEDSGCAISETRLHIGSSIDDFPRDWLGDAVPKSFEYGTTHNPWVTEYLYTIDRSEIGDGQVYIAATATVYCDVERTDRRGRTTIQRLCLDAWADGTPFTRFYGFYTGSGSRYFTYDTTGTAHEGSGIWFAGDYDWAAGTFDPNPNQDIDDKAILQNRGGNDERNYDLGATPTLNWYSNYGIWFDRDGVDQWQATNWGMIDGATYNTGGVYDIVITLHATSDTTGEAYMTVNGVQQGIYELGWQNAEPDAYPVGMTFTGDMKNLQVFYGLLGYGATHSVTFSDITVSQ